MIYGVIPGYENVEPIVIEPPFMPKAPSRGKLCALVLPSYQPSSDLVWVDVPEDNPDTEENESTLLPKENWTNRKTLVNFGGNRVGIPAQELYFDASISQKDYDGAVGSAHWDWGDDTTSTGLLAHHHWDSPGLYTVTCTVDGISGTRYVRILASYGESDLDVEALQLSGNISDGWSGQLSVLGSSTSALVNFSRILLYVYDDLDLRWREDVEARTRYLSRKYAYTGKLPPEPTWDYRYIDSGKVTSSGGSSTNAGTKPTGGCWDNMNVYHDDFVEAGNAEGVPVNLLKAHCYLESCGDPNNKTPTENPDCPYAYGLMQIACGCSAVTCEGNMLDPVTNIKAAAKQLRINYNECGTWEGAVCAYFAGHCVPDGSQDSLETTDTDYVRIVLDRWKEADAFVGGGTTGQPYGEVIFEGYLTNIQPSQDRERSGQMLNLVGSAKILESTSRRREAFFEEENLVGGTTMGQPLKTAHAIHHTLTEHTNFPQKHDVVLDWSGPRFWSTTANEGTMWSGFSAWAQNDFARVWTDRHGSFRYEPHPSFRGKNWFNAAPSIRIDPTLIMKMVVNEVQPQGRTVWTKLCGLLSGGDCEVCAEYPCGGPTPGSVGKWDVRRGLQYDDWRVLCAFAAHAYQESNRFWDVQVTVTWRHDLELNDIINLPMQDPSGRFDWRGPNKPSFIVVGINHLYDTASATWITEIQAQQLTYGEPCDCPKPKCPKTKMFDTGDQCTSDGWQTGTAYGKWTRHYEDRIEADPVAEGIGGMITLSTTQSLVPHIYGGSCVDAIALVYESTSSVLGSIDSRTRWIAGTPSPVMIDTRSTGSNDPGVLTASYDYTSTDGPAGSAGEIEDEEVTYVEFRVLGNPNTPANISLNLIATGTGTGELWLVQMNEDAQAKDTADQISDAGSDLGPSRLVTPTPFLGNPAFIGHVTPGSNSITVAVSTGNRYRLGLRMGTGVSEDLVTTKIYADIEEVVSYRGRDCTVTSTGDPCIQVECLFTTGSCSYEQSRVTIQRSLVFDDPGALQDYLDAGTFNVSDTSTVCGHRSTRNLITRHDYDVIQKHIFGSLTVQIGVDGLPISTSCNPYPIPGGGGGLPSTCTPDPGAGQPTSDPTGDLGCYPAATFTATDGTPFTINGNTLSGSVFGQQIVSAGESTETWRISGSLSYSNAVTNKIQIGNMTIEFTAGSHPFIDVDGDIRAEFTTLTVPATNGGFTFNINIDLNTNTVDVRINNLPASFPPGVTYFGGEVFIVSQDGINVLWDNMKIGTAVCGSSGGGGGGGCSHPIETSEWEDAAVGNFTVATGQLTATLTQGTFTDADAKTVTTYVSTDRIKIAGRLNYSASDAPEDQGFIHDFSLGTASNPFILEWSAGAPPHLYGPAGIDETFGGSNIGQTGDYPFELDYQPTENTLTVTVSSDVHTIDITDYIADVSGEDFLILIQAAAGLGDMMVGWFDLTAQSGECSDVLIPSAGNWVTDYGTVSYPGAGSVTITDPEDTRSRYTGAMTLDETHTFTWTGTVNAEADPGAFVWFYIAPQENYDHYIVLELLVGSTAGDPYWSIYSVAFGAGGGGFTTFEQVDGVIPPDTTFSIALNPVAGHVTAIVNGVSRTIAVNDWPTDVTFYPIIETGSSDSKTVYITDMEFSGTGAGSGGGGGGGVIDPGASDEKNSSVYQLTNYDEPYTFSSNPLTGTGFARPGCKAGVWYVDNPDVYSHETLDAPFSEGYAELSINRLEVTIDGAGDELAVGYNTFDAAVPGSVAHHSDAYQYSHLIPWRLLTITGTKEVRLNAVVTNVDDTDSVARFFYRPYVEGEFPDIADPYDGDTLAEDHGLSFIGSTITIAAGDPVEQTINETFTLTEGLWAVGLVMLEAFDQDISVYNGTSYAMSEWCTFVNSGNLSLCLTGTPDEWSSASGQCHLTYVSNLHEYTTLKHSGIVIISAEISTTGGGGGGGGGGGAMDTPDPIPPRNDCIPSGTCSGWPTAQAIDARIQSSESGNGRSSPLHGQGAAFITHGKTYGINPGVVTAILQRESQLASDGGYLANHFNNFGGNTGTGPCGSEFYSDRTWKVFCDAAQGLEGVFQNLDSEVYRTTGGLLKDVMEVYSPAFENDVADMWNIFRAVAADLGMTLEPETQVYSTGGDCQDMAVNIPTPSGPGYGGYSTMLEYAMHQVGMTISQGPFGAWSHSVCDCYDFSCPTGTPVYPIAPGIVTVSEATSGVYTPNTIIVDTAWGPIRYAHLSQRNVEVGHQVDLGTMLGLSGSAGTGPHLHLGLEGGSGNSPQNYTLTQILQAVGFNLGSF